ncbi:hypothetical protein C4J81_09550 [Deltaproteobacteria bacterium Smac51]|nr:hypothetical protein C4J81_09550 [Deltaproteobacteria bacterium Smac51]
MGRSTISEVYLRDPWNQDHPLRARCDKFLAIFSDTYIETLMEMGLLPESGDYDPALLSDEEFESVFHTIADKLAGSSEAMQLMDELKINFTLDISEIEDLSHLAEIQPSPDSTFAPM